MHTDFLVIGGGIVGLATAHALIDRDHSVTVLEAEGTVAHHQSGRNSGVIHSGLYYAPGSLKAQLCAQGRDEMYRFCAAHDIPHRRCGKVVVATTDAEVDRLSQLEERGRTNGLEGLRQLSTAELARREPHVAGRGALLVPDTGVVDFGAVARTMARLLEDRGGRLRVNHAVVSGRPARGGVELETSRSDFRAQVAINCGGLQVDRIARRLGSNPGVRVVPFRGAYWRLSARAAARVRHLVYPVPDPALPFLGVHLTRTIDDAVEAGPNAILSLARHGYRRGSFSLPDVVEVAFDPGALRLACRHWRAGLGEWHRSVSSSALVHWVQRLLPEISAQDLRPGRAGVRALAVDRRGNLLDDFHIVRDGPMIHVLNVPSPAATASIAIGQHIAEMATCSR